MLVVWAERTEPLVVESLTSRERDVLVLLAKGVTTNAALAERLVISPSTVHCHVASLFRKLDVSNRAEIVSYAWQHGLVR